MQGNKIGLFLCAIFSFSQCNPVNPTGPQQAFTIEEATLGQFSVASYPGKWISDDEIEYLDKATKDVKVFNVAKNKTDVVLKASVLQKYNTTKYEFSADRQFVLLSYDEKPIFRHTKRAKYVVYSVKNGEYYGNNEYLQIAEWSPKGNTLVFVKDNNIYVIRNITPKMEAKQITDDGKPGSVYNGISDWVYEEEILGSGKAFWFSPDGNLLVFITFFDTKVKRETIPEYGEPGNIKNQYQDLVNISYPKSGSTNPTYELRLVELDSPEHVFLMTKYGFGKEIFYDLAWTTIITDNGQIENGLQYLQTNRVQNESTMTIHLPSELQRGREKNNKGWVNTNLLMISKDVKRVMRIEGTPVGKNGNFKHLLYGSSEGSEGTYHLTEGLFDVLKVVHWDENKKIVYYSAAEENQTTSTQIYAVSESKGSKPVCLTCQIKSPEGRTCKEASASFSNGSSYVIISCNGPDPRVVYLYKNTQPLGKPLAILEENAKLRSQLKTKKFPEVMNLTVDVPGPFKADVRLLLPPNVDRSGKTKYPLVIYVYGGPASKNINDAFKLDWGLYMSTNLSVIYGMIDGRNTLRKGENMLFAGYRALGTLEIEDQINVTRSLQKRFPFIDPMRTGIWGWSYGGYATTKVLETDRGSVFKCGIAVAPVADWIYYDSMYTERYMGLPQENPKGYERASVLKDVSNLRNKEYFLIHGNADDNVHYQNAMMIAKVLEKNNIPFELMSYPDEDHSLKNVRQHLYYTMSRFWKKCFNLRV